MQKKLYLTLVFLFYSLTFSGNLYAVNGFANCPMVDGKIDVSELENIATNPGGAITCETFNAHYIEERMKVVQKCSVSVS